MPLKAPPKKVAKRAKRAGVSYPIVYRFARDQRGISLETADRVARALGMTFTGDPRDLALREALYAALP